MAARELRRAVRETRPPRAVASSPAGKDLYEALDRWLNRVPGGLVLSNLGACSIFAALSGSSPATSCH